VRAPLDVITVKSAAFMQLGKPELRPELLNHPDQEIIGRYGAQWRPELPVSGCSGLIDLTTPRHKDRRARPSAE